MIVACPDCSGPFQIADDQVAALVQIQCPHCRFRMVLDFAAANDPGLVERGMKLASGFRSASDYRRAAEAGVVPAPRAKPAIVREREVEVAKPPVARAAEPAPPPHAAPVAAPHAAAPPTAAAAPTPRLPEAAPPRAAAAPTSPSPVAASKPATGGVSSAAPSPPRATPPVATKPAPAPSRAPAPSGPPPAASSSASRSGSGPVPAADRPASPRARPTPVPATMTPAASAPTRAPEGAVPPVRRPVARPQAGSPVAGEGRRTMIAMSGGPAVMPPPEVAPPPSAETKGQRTTAPDHPAAAHSETVVDGPRTPPHTPPRAAAASLPPAEPLTASQSNADESAEFGRIAGGGSKFGTIVLVALLTLVGSLVAASYVVHGTPDPRPLLESLLQSIVGN